MRPAASARALWAKEDGGAHRGHRARCAGAGSRGRRGAQTPRRRLPPTPLALPPTGRGTGRPPASPATPAPPPR
eukprot:2014576-Alexandrium_andersonii.AAC.1